MRVLFFIVVFVGLCFFSFAVVTNVGFAADGSAVLQGYIARSITETKIIKKYKKIAGRVVYRDTRNSALIFYAPLAIDADGSPRAYHPQDTPGLDRLANAGRPGRWHGIVTVNGVPLLQGANDPYPGYYLSCTALVDRRLRDNQPARYVDSERVPYIALPAKQLTGMRLGDFVMVVDLRSGKKVFAIFADIAPGNSLGEGSIALAKAFGVNADPRNGGSQKLFLYLLFPGSGLGQGYLPSVATIEQKGLHYFQHWLRGHTLKKMLKN